MPNKNLVFRSAAALLALAFFSGCAAIPTGGSVNHYADQVAADNSSASTSTEVSGPQPGASQEEIIRGFLHAGAGAGDNFAVARQYLTADMADSWKPDEGTLVYASDFSTTAESSKKQTVTVPTTAKIDSRGIATSYSTASDEKLEFMLVQDKGEWRISSAPQGLVLSQKEFNEDFGPYTVYFYDPSYNFLVPDVRWLANRAATVTSLARLTFEGAAPYLKDAVVNATQQSLSLSRNSVPVDNGVAEIDLSGESSSNLSQTDINKLEAQLGQTLTGVLGVEKIQLSIDGKAMSADSTFADPAVNSSLSEQIVGVGQQGLTLLENYENEKELAIFSIPSHVVSPAMSYSTDSFAALDPDKTRLLLGNIESSSWVLTGQQLTRPSFDQYSWVWTADQTGTVHAVSGNQPEQQVTINASWLKDMSITSLNVSRDGARVVIAGEANGQSQVWVSGIVRDRESFEPKELSEPVRVGTGKSSVADWISDSQVIIGDTDTGNISIVSLSGEKENLKQLPNLATLTAGAGEKEIIATDAEQNVYFWSGTGWSKLTTSYTGLNFSG